MNKEKIKAEEELIKKRRLEAINTTKQSDILINDKEKYIEDNNDYNEDNDDDEDDEDNDDDEDDDDDEDNDEYLDVEETDEVDEQKPKKAQIITGIIIIIATNIIIWFELYDVIYPLSKELHLDISALQFMHIGIMIVSVVLIIMQVNKLIYDNKLR
jgi:hypothetical protein